MRKPAAGRHSVSHRSSPPRRAVVVGASMTGMLAARALSDHFDEVVVLDRDRDGALPVPRAGVPQSRHLHVFWRRGLTEIEHLFPGFERDLVAAGAPTVKFPGEMAWLRARGWRGRFDVTDLVTASRPLIDATVRARLAEVPNVEVVESIEAVGLEYDRAGRVVTGVHTRTRGVRRETGVVRGDLVIDASGRGSATPGWLASIGLPTAREEVVDAQLGYATRFFAIPADHSASWRGLNLGTNPAVNRRMGWMYPQEGNRWVACLGGIHGDHPPTDEEGFLAFAASLRSPVLYEAIRDAVPLSPVAGYRRTSNYRRHYDALTTMPRNFVVMGDAACAFNPVYAQGLTIAAITARTLLRLLDSGIDPTRKARRIQKAIAADTTGAWALATNEDRRYPETEGRRLSRREVLTNRYVAKVDTAANVDATVCAAWVGVLTLQRPLRSLLRPTVAWRALTHRPAPQPHEVDGLRWSDTPVSTPEAFDAAGTQPGAVATS